MKGKPAQGMRFLWTKIIAGLALLAGFGSAVVAEEVGSIAGEFSVANGTATYSIPIQVPQGIAGMQPELSLNYSSQGGNGLLGLGWSLGGLMTIHRCPATLAQDGIRGSVKNDQNDKFCMDGQRLIAVDGAYGDVGTEYRTEIDSIARITSVGGSLAEGPESWLIETKAGQTIKLGATPDSRLRKGPLILLRRYILWQVNEITDAVGNAITYAYNPDKTSGEHYPVSINYAGNSIEFEYEYDRPDKVVAYSNGIESVMQVRISKIASYLDNNPIPIRSYTPTYETTPTTQQSRIKSFEECAGLSSCLPKTVFQYDGGMLATLGFNNNKVDLVSQYTVGSGWTSMEDYPRMLADVDGDGVQDIVGFGHYNVSVRLSSGRPFVSHPYYGKGLGWNPSKHLRMLSDVNGDGRADIVGFWENTVTYSLSQGDSFADPVPWVTGAYTNSGGWKVDQHPRVLADVDGDGKADIVGFGETTVKVTLGNGESFAGLTGYGDSSWDISKNPRTIADVNGDGLGDIVGFSNNGVYVSFSQGDHFSAPANLLPGEFVQASVYLGNYNVPIGENITEKWYARELADANGDGLADVIGIGLEGIDVALSTGSGFLDPVRWIDKFGFRSGETFVTSRTLYYDFEDDEPALVIKGWSEDWHPRQLTDLNGDGRVDVIGFAGPYVYASLSLGDRFGEQVRWHDDFDFERTLLFVDRDDYPRMTGDMNGDGLLDLVGFNENHVTVAYNPLPHPGQMTGIVDGNQIETEIEYDPIAGTNAYYVKQGNNSVGNPDEILSLQIPVHVVTQVSTSNGLGGSNAVTYRYGGMRAHNKGRGLLGFEWVETKNLQTGITNTTEFSQVFPHIGTPQKTLTRAADGTLLNHSETALAANTSYSGKVFFPYAFHTLSTEYELNGSEVKTEEVYNGHYDEVSGEMIDHYDDYGNILKMKTIVSGGGKTFETLNVNEYDDDVANWHLGRVTGSTVTKTTTNNLTGAIASQTRTSAFSYDTNTGLLLSETIEPGSPDLWQTTTYEYDPGGTGNKIKATVTGFGLGEARITQTDYDSHGRYPVRAVNAKGHHEDYVYNQLCGKKESLTGPNGLATSWTYDAFCRLETETRADGTQTTTQRFRVLDSTRYATRPAGMPSSIELYPLANVHYKIVTTTTGQPTVTVYYDQLGRELRKETVGFNSRTVYQDTEYDILGRILRASRSYYVGDPIYWVNFQYDELGRVTNQDAPADYNARAITKTSYNGLITSVTDPKGRVTKSTKDVAGNVIRVDQPDGAFVINRYDPYGNLAETEDVKGNIVKMTYDDRGRKIAMDDPDMGHWEYAYNALGELTWQKDAKDQEVTMEYDVLGRMVERTEAEGVTAWTYDTQPKGIGKLASVSAPDGYSKSMTYDDLGRAKTTITTIDGQAYSVATAYDSAGRVKQVTRPGGFVVENVYDDNGYLLAKRSPASQVTDYDKQHLQDLQALAVTSASEALAKAAQYAADAAYYEQWADTYRTEVAANANVQYLTAEVAALQKHKSYQLYTHQTTGDLYLESPDRVMILHAEIDTPIMIPPAAHYKVVIGADSEWTLQAVDLDTWTSTVLPNLADSGEHVFFGDYNGDGKTDYVRSDQNVENPLYDSALLERLAQTAGEIQYVANTLWNLADNALARANQLIAVAGQVEDRQRQAELWAENSDGDDLTEMGDTTSGAITYWQANTRDAEHRLTGFRQGNGLVTLRDYDPASGHLMGIQTAFQHGSNIRELEYHYDALDNVTSRHDRYQNVSESFQYDSLDRLKKNSVSGSLSGISYSYSTDYEYDLTGNILYKSDVGSYTYGSATRGSDNAGPAALVSAGSSHTGYQYDLNGNLDSGGGRVFQWTSFNKPEHLQKDATWIKFTYGPDRARYLKETSDGESTVYIGKLYERITEEDTGKITHKHFIYAGGELAAIQIKTVNDGVTLPDKTRYMHTDALGSVDTITDGFGNIVERMGFDPFGMRRGGNWDQGLPLELAAFTNRGFTGHEHVDEIGIIHMNGRIYDPELGRFLSADPNIQAPLNSQSHNRYAYVMNNPLKYTDPSGFFLKKLFKSVKRFFKKYGRSVVAIALSFIAGAGALMALTGMSTLGTAALMAWTSELVIAGAIGGFVGGFVASGGDLRSGLIGGLTGAAFGFIGGSEIFGVRGGFTVQRAAAHGVVGGLSSELDGGKFMHGFAGSLIAKTSAGKINYYFKGNPLGGAFASAVVGGATTSALGGKFANGAVTASFSYMFNRCFSGDGCVGGREPSVVGDPKGGFTKPSTLALSFSGGFPAGGIPLNGEGLKWTGVSMDVVIMERGSSGELVNYFDLNFEFIELGGGMDNIGYSVNMDLYSGTTAQYRDSAALRAYYVLGGGALTNPDGSYGASYGAGYQFEGPKFLGPLRGAFNRTRGMGWEASFGF